MASRRRSSSNCPPEAILQGSPPRVQAIAARVRALIRRVLPEVEERGMPGWRLIGYRHGGAYLGFVAPQADHVRLGFERGVLMRDADGLLEGDGTQVRYVVLKDEDLPEEALARLLHEAVALARAPQALLRAGRRTASPRK